jgi:hypothetical protein
LRFPRILHRQHRRGGGNTRYPRFAGRPAVISRERPANALSADESLRWQTRGSFRDTKLLVSAEIKHPRYCRFCLQKGALADSTRRTNALARDAEAARRGIAR